MTRRLHSGEAFAAIEEHARTVAYADAMLLVQVWDALLARTQYVHEVLVAPDGRGIAFGQGDGVRYHFAAGTLSGSADTPRAGTLLANWVELAGQRFLPHHWRGFTSYPSSMFARHCSSRTRLVCERWRHTERGLALKEPNTAAS